MVGQGKKGSVKQLSVQQKAFHHGESQANEGRGLKFHSVSLKPRVLLKPPTVSAWWEAQKCKVLF